MIPITERFSSADFMLSWKAGPSSTGRPSTRLYVLPELRTNPLVRLVRAHSPSRSAAVSRGTVSTPCARDTAGAAMATSAHIDAILIAEFVMARLYPRRVDSEPLHSPIEIWPVRLQPPGGIGHVAARLGQRACDDRALEAVQFVCERRCSLCCRLARAGDSLPRPGRSDDRRVRRVVIVIDDQLILDVLSGYLLPGMQNRQ